MARGNQRERAREKNLKDQAGQVSISEASVVDTGRFLLRFLAPTVCTVLRKFAEKEDHNVWLRAGEGEGGCG